MKRTATALGLGLVVMLAACAGDDDSGATAGTETSTTLADAADVNEANEAEASSTLAYGEAAEQDGVSVLIDGATWGRTFTSGGTQFRDLLVDVIFSNRGQEDVDSPLISYRCSNNDETGNQHDGPIDILDPLPAGSEAEGVATISVTLPCEDGWLEWDPDFDDVGFRWPLPAQS